MAPDFRSLIDLTAANHSELVNDARTVGDDARSGIAFAVALAPSLPPPGSGATLKRWSMLAAAARGSLTAARALEPHADALAILAEAGAQPETGAAKTHSADDSAWGVYAAEGTGEPLRATSDDASTTLAGVKPWCSLAADLDSALVTALAPDGSRRLYQTDLHDSSVAVLPAEGWVARGLRSVVSVAVRFDRTPARAVGAPGWYLERDGFAWGGIGVAACWHGGARALLDDIIGGVRKRSGELAELHVGRAAMALHASAAALRDAAQRIDGGAAGGSGGAQLALAVRGVVAAACEDVLREAAHALGPGPAAFDPAHAARVADLDLYIRQHHAERDLAALGATFRSSCGGPS